MMMHDLGLINIDSRCNDTCNFVQPPYESPVEKYRIEMARKLIEDEDDPEDEKRRREEFKQFFLAGGGSLSSYYRHRKRADQLSEEYKEMHRENLEKGTWFRSWGASSFFCIKARKKASAWSVRAGKG